MAVDFSGLWESARAAAASDEAESVRQMAEILSSKDGRTFILDLEPSDAELCIEILDHVNTLTGCFHNHSPIRLFRVWPYIGFARPGSKRSLQP